MYAINLMFVLRSGSDLTFIAEMNAKRGYPGALAELTIAAHRSKPDTDKT